MCLHLVALIALFALPKFLQAEKRSISSKASTEKTQIGDSCTGTVDACDIKNEKSTTSATTTTDNKLNDFNKINGVNGKASGVNVVNGVDGNEYTTTTTREKFDCATRNVENFIDKTVTGIIELKEDFMSNRNDQSSYMNGDGLRQRNVDKKPLASENIFKQEVQAVSGDIQQKNVISAVLSNGHAK